MICFKREREERVREFEREKYFKLRLIKRLILFTECVYIHI